ncbi:MAG TPA: hypothetical protein VMP11_05570 [Verrucomicrobiae bacterium]|nr:hypothetical protein [Verrucomicrobiae bacterium]
MAAFEYRQAEEVRDAFAKHRVRYLFIGKSGAILLGFPDRTQDAHLFIEKSPSNGKATVEALRSLGFALSDQRAAEIEHGKDFIQIKDGPFDLDLIFATDGIERFEDPWKRHVDVEGFPVFHIDDIIGSKAATNRVKDRESLPRLRSFRDYWLQRHERRERDHPHPAWRISSLHRALRRYAIQRTPSPRDWRHWRLGLGWRPSSPLIFHRRVLA